MAQQIVIDIGARIQVLQSSIVEVQKVLDKLQPNTSAWRDLSKYIQSMRGELDKLILQNGKPVVDQKQFIAAEKSISKIEEIMGKTQLIMDRLKFSDIKLDPNQQKQFNDLQKQMTDAASQFEVFKQKITQDFINTDNNKSILTNLFNANILDKDLDTISNKINTELTKITVEIENRTNEIENLKPGFKIARALANGSNTDLLNSSFLGDEVYKKFFDKNGNFASGMKNQFYDMLADVFKLTPAQKGQLAQLSANDLRSVFKGNTLSASKGMKSLSDLIPKKNLALGAGGETSLNDLINNLRAQEAQLEKLQTTAGTSQADIEAQAQKTAAAQELVNQRMCEFEATVTNGARTAPGYVNSLAQMNSQLQQTRDMLSQTNAQFLQMERIRTSFNAMKMAIVNFMGFRQVLNLVKRGVQEAMTHIKELDSVMNKISIVTDMSTDDLWKQVDAYSQLAQQYGVSIKGAYEVSQIYYQQGLETKDVMTLTNETLKLSKISGLDYATSTDYMTTAIRGFKMEMSEASTVVDVYSNLAANTAVSQEELAVAMSKTASSLEGVGATFEESSAMIATVVAVTRESATNIGSAMKSIASRYGELTKDPLKLVDEEGEEMAFNKVDAALQSVGISMKTVDGQFRNLTDVIVELSEKWDTLESTQQRYIATQFAGNRQQSRFLALVSNKDLLKKNLEVAEDSEDVGALQTLKSLDSIETKLEQVTVAYQQFYTTIGAQDAWKGVLSGATSVINTLNGLPKLFGTLPIGAIQVITSIVGLIKNVGTSILTDVANIFVSVIQESGQAGNQAAQQFTNNFSTGLLGGIQKGYRNIKNSIRDAGYAIGIGRNNSVETQAAQKTDQLNVESARQEFERLKTYAKEELGQTIQLQFDASQPQGSLDQLKIQLEQVREVASDTFKLPQGGPERAVEAFKEVYEQYQTLADNAGQKPIEIKFDINNPKKAVQELRDAVDDLQAQGVDIGRIRGNISAKFGKAEPREVAEVPADQYKELEAEMNNISGIMTTLEAKGKNLSPREAKAMYEQLTQHIKEASIELEKMKQANPNSKEVKEYAEALEQAKTKAAELNTNIQKTKTSTNTLSSAAGALNMIGTLFNNGTESGYALSGAIMGIAGALYLVDGISKAMAGSNPFFALAMGVMGVVNGISQIMNASAKKIEILEKEAEELSNKSKQAQSDEKSLKQTISNLETLKEKRYESAEAAKEYTEAVNDLTTKFPGLIGGFDEAGNAILNASAQERLLAEARQKTAKATYEAAQKEYDLAKEKVDQQAKNLNTQNISSLQMNVTPSTLQSEVLSFAANVNSSLFNFGLDDPNSFISTLIQGTLPEIGETFEDYIIRLKEKILEWIQENEPVNYDTYKDLLNSITLTDGKLSDEVMSMLTNAQQGFESISTIQSDETQQKILRFQSLIADYNSYMDKTSSEAIEIFSNLKQAYEDIMVDEELKSKLSPNELKSIGTNINNIVKIYGDIDDLNKAFEANGVAVAAAYQSLQGINYNYIKNGSSMTNVISESIANAIPEGETWTAWIDSSAGKNTADAKMKAAEKQYMLLMGRYSSDGEELTQLFDKMMSDAASYGFDDIVAKFDINKDSEFYNMLFNYYTKLSETLYDNLNNYLSTGQTNSQGITTIRDKVTELQNVTHHLLVSDEAAFFTELTKVVNNLDASGFSNLGEQVATFGVNLYDAISQIIDPMQKNTVSDLIRKNGIKTREGIQASIDTLIGMGYGEDNAIIKNLVDLQKTIISNIPLAIQTATSNLLDTWEDTSKELTKAMSGGVSLKEANNLIQKAKQLGMDIELSDFISTGDQLILTSTKFNEYWQKLNETNKTNAENWQKQINSAGNILAGYGSKQTFHYTENQKKLLKELGFDITDSTYYKNGKFTDEGITELNRVLVENQKNLDNYNLAAQIAADQLKNSWDRAQGIYKRNAGDLIPIDEAELRKIAKQTKFNLQTSTGISEKAIKDSLNKVYSSFISDVLSKGFENINLADYEGLIKQGEGINLSNFDSYRAFVNEYIDFTGKTIEEINDLIVQAIEKDTQRTSGAADTIKNFKFIDENTFTASLPDLEELANKFGVNINNWLQHGIADWDSKLQAYIVNKDKLTGIDQNDWDQIENLQDIITDSISEYIKSLVDAISKGISGKLSNSDVSGLKNTLATLGLGDVKLSFRETAEGLQLSTQSAIALYTELKKIDGLQASLVFNDLNKSLQENDEHYKSVSDIMAHIVELREKISTADKADTTKIEQYEQELALAKEILAVRSTSEDSSFDFMSNKIPGGQNNPLNYYNSWQKAIKTIQEGAKVTGKKGKKSYAKGFIDYQDFYNIATELGNLAKLGAPIELAGIKLDGSMEKTSELIEKGAAALTQVDTGELKVSLKSVGLDILGGANSLSDGVDTGIKKVAQSQVKMLDGMISLLEAIVKMEELGDIAATSGNTLELEMPDIRVKTANGGYAYTEAFGAWRDAMLKEIEEGKTAFAKASKQIKIGNKTLAAIIGQEAKDWTEDQVKVLNALQKAAKSGLWDPNDPASSMKEVLASAGFGEDTDLTIDVGDVHYIIKGGTVIESIDFNSDGAKAALKSLMTKPEYKNNKNKAKKEIIKQVDAYNRGNPENITLDYYLIAEATGNLQYDKKTKKHYVTFNGTQYDTTQGIAMAMRGKEVAKLLGITSKEVEIDTKNNIVSGVKITQTLDSQQFQIELKIGNNGRPEWSCKYNNETITGSSENELYQNIFKAQQKEDKQIKANGESKSAKELDFDQWMYLTFGVTVNTSTKITKDGKPIDNIKNEAGLGDAIQAYLKGNTIGNIEDNLNGTSTITLGDYKIRLDTSKIKIGSEWDKASIDKELGALFNIDTTLTNAISQGITNSIPSVVDGLNAMGEQAQGVNNVASAVGTLFQYVSGLTGIAWNTIAQGLAAISNANGGGKTYAQEKENLAEQAQAAREAAAKKAAEEEVAKKAAEKEAAAKKAADEEAAKKAAEEEAAKKAAAEAASAKQQQDGYYRTIEERRKAEAAAKKAAEEEANRKSANHAADIQEKADQGKQFGNNSPVPKEEDIKSAQAAGEEVGKAYAEAVEEASESAEADWSGGHGNYSQIRTDNSEAAGEKVGEAFAQGFQDGAKAVSQSEPSIVEQTVEESAASGEKAGQQFGEEYWENMLQIAYREKRLEKDSQRRGELDKVIEEYKKALAAAKDESAHEAGQKTGEAFNDGFKETVTQGYEEDLNAIASSSKEQLAQGLADYFTSEVSRDDAATVQDFVNYLDTGTSSLGVDTEEAKQALLDYMLTLDEVPPDVKTEIESSGAETANEKITALLTSINNLPSLKTIKIKYEQEGQPRGEGNQVAGNVGLAKAAGTLMGELGPELVVSNGRYFIAGQSGAEMVDLAPDAIVFNHLQTEQLLKKGMSPGRGRAVTNERTATAFAKGNIHGGPAMASASAALSALKQLRDMWKRIAEASVTDMASKAGGGGGGGGGKDKDAAFIRDVERWYNWLQKIAQLEKEITYQEQLRSKIESDREKDGYAYYRSQVKSLKDINAKLETTTSLKTSQQAFFDQRRRELNNNSPFKRFYTFDENGQLKYNSKGFAELSNLFGRNEQGKPNYSAEQQYNKLVAMGYAQYMKYDSSGKEIKPEGKKKDATYYENAVKAFSERMDSEKEEMQSLHDSIEEYEKNILEMEDSRNQLLQEIVDNQIEVENQILQAIEDMRQTEIDEVKANRDAYSESTEQYINGLSNALAKEQQMYQDKENTVEIERLRRQLAILERSGGSASQISNLQKDIQSKEKDLYFDRYQEQIDAIKNASDLQIQRMDHQIKIMEETLAYEKAHGLLWAKVYEVMNRTPAEISEFITTNTKSIKEQSAIQSSENIEKMEWQIEQWKAYQEDKDKEINQKHMDQMWNRTSASFKETYGKVWTKDLDAQAKKAYEENYDMYADPNMAQHAAQQVFAKAQANYDAKNKTSSKSSSTAAKDSKKPTSSGTTKSKNLTYKDSKEWYYDLSQHWHLRTYSNGEKEAVNIGSHKYSNNKCTICGRENSQYNINYSTGQAEKISEGSKSKINGYIVTYTDSKTKKKKQVRYTVVGNGGESQAYSKAKAYATKVNGTVSKYATGGLVDYTGLAQVDGTPTRPEAFLNAEQTATLKKGLLGGKNSLVSVLADFQAMLKNSEHAPIEKGGSSIVIENATVEMNVSSIANDYDARRAGEQALEQMLKIARKTGAQSVSRR